VTSSYHSTALGRSFALVLIKNGRKVGDRLVDIVVGNTFLCDPEGNCRDG
jgi:sarcosine oxidase, subunit alpha